MSPTLTNSDIAAMVAEKMKDAQDAFGVYFRQNYPGPDTIIHNPDWHATRIFRAATHQLKALIESQAAELATLRAERDELQAAILSSAGAEYILEHPIETDAERMGRKSAVRGMMVRLGLYLQLEQAIDAAIALKGGAT